MLVELKNMAKVMWVGITVSIIALLIFALIVRVLYGKEDRSNKCNPVICLALPLSYHVDLVGVEGHYQEVEQAIKEASEPKDAPRDSNGDVIS